jgi:hypothetical protein
VMDLVDILADLKEISGSGVRRHAATRERTLPVGV